MQRIPLSAMALGLLLLSFNGVLFASAAGELQERAKVLRKEAAVMAERGSKELVGRLESKAVWSLETAQRQGDRPDITLADELRERARALREEAAVMAGQRQATGRAVDK